MTSLTLQLWIVLSVACLKSTGYKYFFATPSIPKSLNGLMASISYALADAGHDVTFVSPFPIPKEHSKITVVKAPTVIDDSLYNIFELTSVQKMAEFVTNLSVTNAELFWGNSEMRNLLTSLQEHDAYVTMSYMNELVFPFLDHFEGPVIQICTPGVEYYSLTREGNWLPPSVVTSFLLNFDEYMTFWERSLNLLLIIYQYFLQYALVSGPLEVVQKYNPQVKDLISYYDRVALTLINGHFALDGPVPLLPSQIEIGTINAKKPQPLPKDLEHFVQGSGDAGIIYFSLGSIAKSSDIPQRAKEMFVEAFRRVPQRVLWKYEGTDLQLSPNVKTQSWMPQQDILGHPKTRVFISHCGNLGTQEAKFHGVPTLGVPIAFDQPRNAARMERKGYAIVIQWEDMTTDKIVDALEKLINDTTYKERLSAVARVLQDQKESPAERAVYWMEYIVRHKGAPHLQYAGRRLSLFQYIMLDVILLWAAVLFIFLFLIAFIIKVVCCKRSKTKTNSKSTKQYKKKYQ